jgi:hypothetical protein
METMSQPLEWIETVGDTLEMQRCLLHRELEFWTEEGRDRAGDRIFYLRADSPEAEEERAWQEHCLKRLNAAAWELEEVEKRGSRHDDAHFVNIENWRNRGS